ncbi:unnamed protein product [Gordionus sp. m RMFG-2023]
MHTFSAPTFTAKNDTSKDEHVNFNLLDTDVEPFIEVFMRYVKNPVKSNCPKIMRKHAHGCHSKMPMYARMYNHTLNKCNELRCLAGICGFAVCNHKIDCEITYGMYKKRIYTLMVHCHGEKKEII